MSDAACAGPECTWERPCCEPRLAATSTGPGTGQQNLQSTLRHATACLKDQPLKVSWVVCELGVVGSQEVTKVEQVVFTRLM